MTAAALALSAEQLRLVRQLVHQVLPGATVAVFGSRATGRARPFSDLDLLVCDPPRLSWAQRVVVLCLGRLRWGVGDSTPQQAAALPSADLTGTTGCTIALGASTCHPTITWASAGSTNPVVKLETQAGSVLVNAFAASGTNTSQAIGAAAGAVVAFYDNSTKLAEVSIQGICGGHAILNAGVCVARRVPLASAAVQAGDAGYLPQAVHVYADGSHETLTPVLDTAYAIGSCVIRRAVQATSQPLNCGDAAGVRHELSWIKASNRIVPYDGASGVLPPITDSVSPDGYWLDVSDPDLVNLWSRAYTAAAGTFFAKSDRRFLYFRAIGTGTERQVSGDLGTIKALTGF